MEKLLGTTVECVDAMAEMRLLQQCKTPEHVFLNATLLERLQGTVEGDRLQQEDNEDQLALAMLQNNCETAIKKFQGVLSCSKCGSNRISIRQKQSRAADEGMTLYCACECGKSWKM